MTAKDRASDNRTATQNAATVRNVFAFPPESSLLRTNHDPNGEETSCPWRSEGTTQSHHGSLANSLRIRFTKSSAFARRPFASVSVISPAWS